MAFTHLLRRADQGSLERGADYADRGLVEVLSTTPTRVTAVVRGSVEYDVVLDGRDGDCTCPVGQRGQFCKHLVATVLTLDERATNSVADDLEDDDAPATPEELAELVDSLRVRGHPDYWKANALGEYASDVADRLERALSADTADDLLPLLERGIDLVTRGMLRSDDSSGLQGIALQQLFDLHARAALLSSPDPGRLARWMVKTGFAEHGATRVDPVDYAEALGERGLAAYARGVERHAAARPDGYEVRDARERLAVLARDIPAIIELAGGPLDNGMRYQHVVRTLLEVDAQDEALFYAEQGLGISSMEHAVVPLYDEAVRLRTLRGDLAAALELRRRQLAAFPTAASYGALQRAARPLGCWEGERLVALDVLLERNPRDYVAILLKEGHVDLAWEVSRTMDLRPDLAVRLLQARARTHPAEVFDDYVSLIDDELREADQQRYRQAIAYLGDLRRAASKAGLQQPYADYVDELLRAHQRRPKLIEMLRRMPPAG